MWKRSKKLTIKVEKTWDLEEGKSEELRESHLSSRNRYKYIKYWQILTTIRWDLKVKQYHFRPLKLLILLIISYNICLTVLKNCRQARSLTDLCKDLFNCQYSQSNLRTEPQLSKYLHQFDLWLYLWRFMWIVFILIPVQGPSPFGVLPSLRNNPDLYKTGKRVKNNQQEY